MMVSRPSSNRIAMEEYIESALANLSPPECEALRDKIVSFGLADATPRELFEALTRGPEERRLVAAWLLGKRRSARRFTGPLLEVLEAPATPERLRQQVSQTLAELGGRAVEEGLLAVLHRAREVSARKAAAYGLGSFSSARVLNALVAVGTDAGEPPCLRALAIEAIGHSAPGCSRLPVGLEKRVRDLLSDRKAEVRYWAAFALSNFGTGESLPELERLAIGDSGEAGDEGRVSGEASEAATMIRVRMNALLT